jgi:carbamoyltransferase
MLVLGLHDGHNSGATLISDGKVIASVSEERLTRRKNEVGFPTKSIQEVIGLAAIDVRDIAIVAFASNYMHTAEHLNDVEKWYRSGVKDQAASNAITESELQSNLIKRRNERTQQVTELLEISSEKIRFVDHHTSHAAAAYFGSHFEQNERVLIVTCDGAGDNLSATVSIGFNGQIKRIAETGRDASLGKIYSRVTYALGLKPWEHEYKVMGLAPYAYQNKAKELTKVYKEILKISEDGLKFERMTNFETSYIYDYLKNKFERCRFDEIAASVQIFTEEMLVEWVFNCVKSTGIRKVAAGGGVFMNVKANMRIAQLDCIEDFFIFPSCGDESLSYGAAWYAYYTENPTAQKMFMNDVYHGGEFHNGLIDKEISKSLAGQGYKISLHDNIESEVSKLLSENNVVARFFGRMEWGARALGNRSILANPSNWENIEKINSMIKLRDFWMPFAPSMIADKESKYLINPKGIKSPYMMLGYETTKLAQNEITAAIHPRDKTARAQFVTRKSNPEYYKVIEGFQSMTGKSAVLNTSFNLHGYPLVYTPYDAIDVFKRSGLDCLALGDYLISK